MVSSPEKIRFGVFEFDCRSLELHKRGVRLALQPLAAQTLGILLKSENRVVTREDLRRELWPSGTFVDFDHGIHNSINRIREVLSDSATTPRFIETLPKRGYRFIAPIQSRTQSETPENKAGTLSEAAAPSSARSKTIYFFACTVFLVCLGAFLLYIRFERDNEAIPMTSLAVLPLENLSLDPAQQYLADAITDELITALAKIPALKVISRTSSMRYKGAHEPLRRIASDLGVQGIVEGTVLRSGRELRISVQLIRASTDKHLWAEEYREDLSNLLKLEHDIARDVCREIRARASPGDQRPGSSRD